MSYAKKERPNSDALFTLKNRITSHCIAAYRFSSYLTSYLNSPYLKKKTVFDNWLIKRWLLRQSHYI